MMPGCLYGVRLLSHLPGQTFVDSQQLIWLLYTPDPILLRENVEIMHVLLSEGAY